jgi:hypothetical protein
MASVSIADRSRGSWRRPLMNLLPEVFVKVIATTQAQCVNTPDFEVLREGRVGLFRRDKKKI